MKIYKLIVLLMASFLLNISILSAKEIYHNIEQNKEENKMIISIYEGENEKYLVPLKKYIIAYLDNGFPSEKIVYLWNTKKRNWILSDKYEYLYRLDRNPCALVHFDWNAKYNIWDNESEYEMFLFDLDKELLSVNNIK